MSILDISDEERAKYSGTAPVEQMVLFLDLCSKERYREALLLSKQILSQEPNNKVIKEYVDTLTTLIKQQDEEAIMSKYADTESSESEEKEGDTDSSDDDDDDDDTSSSDSEQEEKKRK